MLNLDYNPDLSLSTKKGILESQKSELSDMRAVTNKTTEQIQYEIDLIESMAELELDISQEEPPEEVELLAGLPGDTDEYLDGTLLVNALGL